MSRAAAVWCCWSRPQHAAANVEMGAALTHEDVVEGGPHHPAPITMAEVIRERKKKCSSGGGLNTLRRRLGAVRKARACSRQDRDCEHARHIRSIVSSWRPAEVAALHEEYETLHALRDLTTQAELARCPAGTLHADMAALYTDRFCAEATLVWRGASFAVHRSILSARCPYLRDVLNAYPGTNARIVLEGLPYSMTPADLDSVLFIIYAGEEGLRLVDSQMSNAEEQQCQPDLDILSTDQSHNGRAGLSWRRGCHTSNEQLGLTPRQLAEQLGVAPSRLARDLARVLHDGACADAALVFSSEAAHGFRSKLELPCHRAILAARSPFFRSVIRRLLASSPASGGVRSNNNAWNSASNVLRVSVDENVLPRRLARALLHAAYTDQLDLSLISRNSPGVMGQANGNSYNFGGCKQLEDACELYEIAKFLEMAIVSQRCEDAIVETLSAETLPHILRWSSQEHASKWVYRQAMRYLREEFVSLCCTANPCLLEREHMASALQSNYLQASEAQALRALIRWGERTLSGWSNEAANGKGRRGARRPPAEALRAHIAPLVPHLRLHHLQPISVLQQAIRRGLLPESYANCPSTSSDAWLGRPPHRPARLFMPYYDEIKSLLEDQNVSEAEVMELRHARFPQQIPDALYMVTTPEAACGSALASLRARVRELCALARPLAPHAAPRARAQLALRAARERDLPDALARHIAPETPPSGSDDENAEMRSNVPLELDVCMPCSSGQANLNDQRYGLNGSLSVRVPDVAVCGAAQHPGPAPSQRVPSQPGAAQQAQGATPHAGLFNANTHLLSSPYCRGIFTPWRDSNGGAVMQLDLGDGATHAPRAGSRASRARRAQSTTGGCPVGFVMPHNNNNSDTLSSRCSGSVRPATADNLVSANATPIRTTSYLSVNPSTSKNVTYGNVFERHPASYKDPYGQGTSYGNDGFGSIGSGRKLQDGGSQPSTLDRFRHNEATKTEKDSYSSRESTLERLSQLHLSRDNTLERLKELDRYEINPNPYEIRPRIDYRISSLGRKSPCHERMVGRKSPLVMTSPRDMAMTREMVMTSPREMVMTLRRENSDISRDRLSLEKRMSRLSPCLTLGRERLSLRNEGMELNPIVTAPGPSSPRRRRELSAFRPVHSAFNSPAYSNRSPGSSRGQSPASYT